MGDGFGVYGTGLGSNVKNIGDGYEWRWVSNRDRLGDGWRPAMVLEMR